MESTIVSFFTPFSSSLDLGFFPTIYARLGRGGSGSRRRVAVGAAAFARERRAGTAPGGTPPSRAAPGRAPNRLGPTERATARRVTSVNPLWARKSLGYYCKRVSNVFRRRKFAPVPFPSLPSLKTVRVRDPSRTLLSRSRSFARYLKCWACAPASKIAEHD